MRVRVRVRVRVHAWACVHVRVRERVSVHVRAHVRVRVHVQCVLSNHSPIIMVIGSACLFLCACNQSVVLMYKYALALTCTHVLFACKMPPQKLVIY